MYYLFFLVCDWLDRGELSFLHGQNLFIILSFTYHLWQNKWFCVELIFLMLEKGSCAQEMDFFPIHVLMFRNNLFSRFSKDMLVLFASLPSVPNVP